MLVIPANAGIDSVKSLLKKPSGADVNPIQERNLRITVQAHLEAPQIVDHAPDLDQTATIVENHINIKAGAVDNPEKNKPHFLHHQIDIEQLVHRKQI